jgi:hypothetical protein
MQRVRQPIAKTVLNANANKKEWRKKKKNEEHMYEEKRKSVT